MSHDHIGIPKFIEKGFSNDGKVYCYNLKKDKHYFDLINKLGTKNNYYDEDVEKNLLAQGVELQFSLFYNDFCKANDSETMIKILNNNIKLVEQFFSFMFMRSITTLNEINDKSETSKLFGEIDHSELLRINSEINVNPFKIIGDEYSFYPLINFSDTHFINNSIGFGFLINKEKKISIFIPLNFKIGLLITNNQEIEKSEMTYIESNEDEKVHRMNKVICRTEKVIGNGFIFGDVKELVISYINFIKNLKV